VKKKHRKSTKEIRCSREEKTRQNIM